jgi:hypothetical protein
VEHNGGSYKKTRVLSFQIVEGFVWLVMERFYVV